MAPVALAASSAVTAAGVGLAALAAALTAGQTALRPNSFTQQPLDCYVGQVAEISGMAWPVHWAAWDSRATRLAWLALQSDGMLQAVKDACRRHGAERVGLVIGTSASTIGSSEMAYRQLADDGGFPEPLRHEALHSLHAVTEFVQQAAGIQGPGLTVSTACSSSAKAFAVAQRWLALGLVDAVLVGGVDALCDSVVFGFEALRLVARQACTPFGAGRSGISVGEAAAFVLLNREREPGSITLVGYGEASDAHHMSSPHPQGLGAELALDAALARAGVAAADVQYLQLHGTGTPLNDAVEACLVARRYPSTVHASAIKGCVGHTMGAAGILGVLACGLALQSGLRAGTVGVGKPEQIDPSLPGAFASQLHVSAQHAPTRLAASHAFGFGGNNAVILLARGAG